MRKIVRDLFLEIFGLVFIMGSMYLCYLAFDLYFVAWFFGFVCGSYFIIDEAKERFVERIEVIDSFIPDFEGTPLEFLAESLKLMAAATIVIFAKGYDYGRNRKTNIRNQKG